MSTTLQSVKISFGEDLRRLPLSSSSFGSLEESIKSIYSLGTTRIVVKYLDDENDWINVSSDRELEVAIELAKRNALRLSVSLDKSEKAGEVIAPPLPSGGEVIVPPLPFGGEPLYPQLAPVETTKEWKGKFDKKYEKKYEKFQKKTDCLQKKSLKHGAARFVSDTFPDGSVLAPNQEFIKTWTIRNESLESWPQTYQFTFQKGHNMSSFPSIYLPKSIAPGEEFQIAIPMRAPSTLGKHVCVWRLIGASGKPFGQPFRVKIVVSDGNSTEAPFEIVDLETKLRDLAAIGFQDRFLNEKLLRRCKGDMDKVVWKLSKKVNKEKKKEDKMEKKKEKIERKWEKRGRRFED